MIIEEYKNEWANNFEILKKEFLKNIKSFIRIEHIGSTSIPGMFAKPIIDIDIEILNMDQFQNIKFELEDIGYNYKGNQGIINREVFKRNINHHNQILNKIPHHLYVCPSYSNELKNHILFRNFLRKNNAYVEQYNRIKFDILAKYGVDNREKYVEIKENEYKDFFSQVIELSIKEEKSYQTIVSSQLLQ